MKTCQSCKTSNPDNAHFCRHCGKRFNDWKEEIKRSASDQKLISNLQHDLFIKSCRVSGLQSEKLKIRLCLWSGIALIFILLCSTLYYCYRLEQPSYLGKRYISNIIGQRNFIMIDGKSSDIEVTLNADGNPIRYTIQTNLDSVHIYGQPDWVKVEYNDSSEEMFVSALPNFTKIRASHFSIGDSRDTIGIRVTQKSRGKKALTVNGYSSVKSNVAHLGETIYYDITSEDGECKVKSKPNWCTIERNKNGILAISYKRNPMKESRDGDVVLESEDFSATIHVNQKGGEIKPISGKIQSVKIDHNVYEDSIKGMRFHIDFTVNNMLNFDGRVCIYFYHANGTKLKDTNGKYNTIDGQVCCGKNFLPCYEISVWNNFEIFMPYNEFDLYEGGKYNLKCICYIWDFSQGENKGKTIARSEYFNFYINK